MYSFEKNILNLLTERLKKQFPDRTMAVHAFGSRVRGNHREWSDFDVLVIVKDKTPEIETEIISLFVEEEIQSGIPFSVVIKDIKAFKMERNFKHHFISTLRRKEFYCDH